MKKYLFPLLLVSAGLNLVLRAFTKSNPENAALQSTSYDAIDTYIQEQMRRLNIPGASLAIVAGNQIVHQRGFGHARPDGAAPTPQTPFFIGSTTKSFTALAVMQLVEAGKIELDVPVQCYLPWFRVANPQASAQITVRHLLNQTSGLPLLPGWQILANFDHHPGAVERQARALSKCKLSHPVGSAFEYSNLNYNLLGLVIEAASGETYADYLQNHIFDPLEMSCSYTSQSTVQKEDLAVGYQSWFGFPIAAPDLPVPSGSLPSGQLISSAEDMGRYLIAYLNGGRYGEGQILSPEGIGELHHPAVAANTFGTPEWYGMGWYIEKEKQPRLIYHSGMIPNFYAYMALLPEQKKGVVLLFNANHFTGQFTLTEIGVGVTALFAGNQPPPLRFGFIPWVVRGSLLFPLLQVLEVAATLKFLRRWSQDPLSRPSESGKWGWYLLLPIILHLIPISSGLALLGSKLRGFLLLFMPDLSWLALISGGFALVWTFLRTRLVFRALRGSHHPVSARHRQV